MRDARFLGALALGALLLVSCSGADEAARPAGGKTRTLITDDPFPYSRVASVDVFVVSVSASVNPDTGASGAFVTLAEPNRRINLLALQNGLTDELGTADLPSGAITAVRLIIDTDRSTTTHARAET